MKPSNNVVRKRLRLDPIQIERAQRILKGADETENIERALEFVIEEDRRDRVALRAHRRFLKSVVVARDVYGAIES